MVQKSKVTQWGVVLGVWWAILVDCLGNWEGQDHAPCWLPIIWGTSGVLIFLHGLAIGSLRR